MLRKIGGHTIQLPISGTVIDVGVGNDWDFSLGVLKAGADRVIAIDPDPRTKDPPDERITLLRAAAWRCDGHVDIYFAPTPKETRLTQYADGQLSARVESIDLLRVLTGHDPIAAIKLDCEGAESRLLPQIRDAVRRGIRVGQISVEFHDHVIEAPKRRTLNISMPGFKVVQDAYTPRRGRWNYWDTLLVCSS